MDSSSEVAFLVYKRRTRRFRNDAWDSYGNLGVVMIADVLKRAGISTTYCTAETAHKYRVVLISFTALYDIIAVRRVVDRLSSWKSPRKFIVLAGGFGVQNPHPICDIVDYAFYGRGEHDIVWIVQKLLGGGVPESPHMMNFPEISPVTVCQTEDLYPHEIGHYQEQFTGCQNRCKFCLFTYARKHVAQPGVYMQKNEYTGEIFNFLWEHIVTRPLDWHVNFTRAAIDGSSERLRFLYGKKITNQDIIDGIEHLGSEEPTGKARILNVPNIVNYPYEAPGEIEDLCETMRRTNPKYRMMVVFQHTAFRPEVATPMQWEMVTLRPGARTLRKFPSVPDRPNIDVYGTKRMESMVSHFISAFLGRYQGTEQDRRIMLLLCHSKKFSRYTTDDQIKMLERRFDLSPYLMEYDIDGPPPVDMVQSYISTDKLRVIARRMRKRAKETYNPNYYRKFYFQGQL